MGCMALVMLQPITIYMTGFGVCTVEMLNVIILLSSLILLLTSYSIIMIIINKLDNYVHVFSTWIFFKAVPVIVYATS